MSQIHCRIAVCDDESIYIDQIREFLALLEEKHNTEYTVLHFSTAQDLLNAPFDYDILLLDIRLNAGNDGIDVGKLLRKKGNRAVFILISSLQDRYKDGYRLTIHRFLEKPFVFDDFEEAIIGAFDSISYDSQKVKIHYKTSGRYINVADIIYLESYYRSRFVVTKTEKLITKETLDEIEPRLPSNMFYRAQKSFIVNLGHVIQATKSSVTMADKRKIVLSRGSFDALDYALTRFLKEQNR